jgi:hypothetical protein
MGDCFEGRGIGEFIPGKNKKFSLIHSVQIGSGARSASYLIGTEGSFLRE